MVSKKRAPKKKFPQQGVLSGKSELRPKPTKDLKAAIEEVGLLNAQREKLLGELAFIDITLKDLAECRLDNQELRAKHAVLESALRKCQEELANLKRAPE